MTLCKNTRIEDRQRVHVWTDSEHGFKAEVRKDEGLWKISTSTNVQRTAERYVRAVDIVMDEWRLAKAGHGSWAEDTGVARDDLGA